MFQQKCCNPRGTNSDYFPSPHLTRHLIVSLFEATRRRHCLEERGEEDCDISEIQLLAVLLFEMSQIRSRNFSAYFSLIPSLRNKQTKPSPWPLASPPRYFVSFAHFFPFMSRVIYSIRSHREIFSFSTISAPPHDDV